MWGPHLIINNNRVSEYCSVIVNARHIAKLTFLVDQNRDGAEHSCARTSIPSVFNQFIEGCLSCLGITLRSQYYYGSAKRAYASSPLFTSLINARQEALY